MDRALYTEYASRFGSIEGVRRFHAPGRVNLIGEHTDYNGGLVFPCAIDRGTDLLIRETSESRIKLASTRFDFSLDTGLKQASEPVAGQWFNYPLGVLDQFTKRGIPVSGIECLYHGSIPNGAGLSSSASINVVTATALNAVYECGLSPLELAQIARACENDFIGLACGIMDPYAVAMGRAGCAMELDCSALECEHVPLSLEGYTLLVANTNQRRELGGSGYNTRHAECVQAFELVERHCDIGALAALDAKKLRELEPHFRGCETAYRRARHVVSEQARVRAACEALRSGELEQFGEQMCSSHRSLAQDFEVSTGALDALVNAAMCVPGVLGSRMTGAGFGGCTVSLVADASLDRFEMEVAERYNNTTGLSADFYRVVASNGAREVIA